MAYMKPMKGVKVENEDLHRLTYPLLASLKYDGIRCITPNCRPNTNRMKDIPNHYVRKVLSDPMYVDLDGELIVGKPNLQSTFNTTQSAIMSYNGEPNFKYYVFDLVRPGMSYLRRKRLLLNRKGYPHLHIVKQHWIDNEEELLKFEGEALSNGYEGIMIRQFMNAIDYKFGKCTLNQGWLLKRKPFLDDEAIITEVYEQYENTNKSKTNAIGLNKRSKEKAGMKPKGTLGGFKVFSERWGHFKVATGKGLTLSKRKEIWEDRENQIGQYITFKYLPVGVKDKPRSPIYLHHRDARDVST